MKLLIRITVFLLAAWGGLAQGAASAVTSSTSPQEPWLVLPWYNGVIQDIGTDYACLSDPPIFQIRVQGYAGFTLRPPNLTPAVGELFYAHLVLSHPGNPCAGSAVVVGLVLPPGVQTAVSAGNPVFCFGKGASGTLYDLSVDSGYGCPQTFGPGLDNSLTLIPPRGGLVVNGQKSYTWGMAQSFYLEFLVPLIATAPQAGNNNVAWRVNPDIGVVGFPKVPLFVNNDVIFRTANEDNELYLDIAF
jgi:hypothetical protein